MSQSIRISDELHDTIREDAARESRSLTGQIEHYIQIGRAIARSPDFNQDHVELALNGGIEVSEMTLEEQEAFFAKFAQRMENPGASHDYWEDRRRRGVGVGELPDGTRVRQVAGGAVETY